MTNSVVTDPANTDVLNMYNASIPPMVLGLKSLQAILDKAEHHATENKIDPSVVLNYRLAADMFTLTRQVQLTADFAKGCAARLAGVDVPKFEDTEASFAELKTRITKTLDFIASVDPHAIAGSETRDITIPVGGQPKVFKGMAYLNGFAVPNFYFHATAAYAILRHIGVKIGKRDFLGWN
jgi:hypothetical protein